MRASDTCRQVLGLPTLTVPTEHAKCLHVMCVLMRLHLMCVLICHSHITPHFSKHRTHSHYSRRSRGRDQATVAGLLAHLCPMLSRLPQFLALTHRQQPCRNCKSSAFSTNVRVPIRHYICISSLLPTVPNAVYSASAP